VAGFTLLLSTPCFIADLVTGHFPNITSGTSQIATLVLLFITPGALAVGLELKETSVETQVFFLKKGVVLWLPC
jgi:hypothetical protein